MAVQKRRQSAARRDQRRAIWMAKVKQPNNTSCPRCQAPRLPHHVCMACGFYDGRKVIEVKTEGEAE